MHTQEQEDRFAAALEAEGWFDPKWDDREDITWTRDELSDYRIRPVGTYSVDGPTKHSEHDGLVVYEVHGYQAHKGERRVDFAIADMGDVRGIREIG